MINAMEQVSLTSGYLLFLFFIFFYDFFFLVKGENIITQGETGDYFYVIEKGLFTVLVNGASVGKLEIGAGFGELALSKCSLLFFFIVSHPPNAAVCHN